MHIKIDNKVLPLIALLACSALAFAQPVKEPPIVFSEWTRSYPPFRIAGNLYYVGTYDLACYLITTPKGHILINTGVASSFDVIKSNVTALGFHFSEIEILLTTQAHYDHMGAMAAIKKETGARMMVEEKDAEVAANGGLTDYAMGGEVTFAPVAVDRRLHDNEVVALGDMKVTLLHHPGHTKGSSSYLFNVKDGKITYRVLIANMPSIVTDKPLNDIPAYPDIAKDYAYTLKAMKSLSFDLWLSSHASQFHLHQKRTPRDPYGPGVFRDQKGYDKALADLQKAYDERVAVK